MEQKRLSPTWLLLPLSTLQAMWLTHPKGLAGNPSMAQEPYRSSWISNSLSIQWSFSVTFMHLSSNFPLQDCASRT